MIRRGMAVGGLWAALLDCSAHDAAPSPVLPLPPEDSFAVVSSVLEPNCGTLDCHGSSARNLRIYGKRGLRADGRTSVGDGDTTPEEIHETFRSIVSLEPERLSEVFTRRGEGVERWLVVSKARGRERHIGGIRLPEGSAGDRCLVTWASGSVDASACTSDVFGPIPLPGETW
ncbi:MAG: hypothetical protein U0270_28125 [Labilithrix sp.]